MILLEIVLSFNFDLVGTFKFSYFETTLLLVLVDYLPKTKFLSSLVSSLKISNETLFRSYVDYDSSIFLIFYNSSIMNSILVVADRIDLF